MSNISEILFSSDLVRMVLTQVIIWRENWKRLFPAKYSLLPGDLSQCQQPDRWWTMHCGKPDLKLSRRFTTVFLLADVFQLLHCNLENYASKKKHGLRFSIFCNVKIYWNLLILLNKMNLQCLTLSCNINSYKLEDIAIQRSQNLGRCFMTTKKTPGNSMWPSPIHSFTTFVEYLVTWGFILRFFLRYLYKETFLRRKKIKTYCKTFHLFSLCENSYINRLTYYNTF